MVRTPRYDKNGLKKGTWTPDEDKKLIDYVTRFGHKNWRQLPKSAGLARCGKSCRLRWKNYLRPDVKRGNYTQEEEETIVKLHAKFGNRWSMMASHLSGRSDNEIKNYWHSHLKKRFQHTTSLLTNEKSVEATNLKNHHTPVELSTANDQTFHNNDSPASSQSHQTPDFFCTTLEPALSCDTNSDLNYNPNNLMEQNYIEPIVSEDFWTGLYVNDYSYFPGELLEPFVTESECSSPDYDAHFWDLME